MTTTAITFQAFAQTPHSWSEGAYAYAAQNTPLKTVLQDFATSHSVSLNIPVDFDVNVDGRLRADSPSDFLNRLGLQYRFQWFVYNDTLYISRQSDQISRRIKVSADAAPDLKQALTDVGLLESKFGFGELPDDGVVIVTGPPEYVRLIQDFSAKDKDKKTSKQMMVFPLKYASVADRNIQYRDKTILVPGVATILAELLGQKTGKSASGVQQNSDATGGMKGRMEQQIRDQSDSILNDLVNSQTSGPKSDDDDNPDELHPYVSADVRNNALLIRDDPSKRDEYQSLVSQIDIPQKLVEIDAMIVDVDRKSMNELGANLRGTFGNITAGSTLFRGASSLFVTDYSRFFSQIQALEGSGNASIVANPSILTLENQPAVIDLSDTAFISEVGERVAEIEPVTAGTSLQVMPRAIGTGQHQTVQLDVNIEDGKVDRDDDNKATGDQKVTISTQALVQENGSLVMGGIHSRETGDMSHRIPVLGDIPYIGHLFSYTRHETNQRERLFIITPHLIGDQVDPTRYISARDRQQLASDLRGIQNRQEYSAMRGNIENALRDLAENKVPEGFESGGEGVAINQLCTLPSGLMVDNSRTQWFNNKTVQLSVGVMKNITTQPIRFDESSCADDDVLAAAVWPGSTIAPGQQSEIYVAFRSRGESRRSRQSLLTSNSNVIRYQE
nr:MULTISPECIES: type III secretion system outer membrane ring subunit SctC [Pantoea]